MSWPLVTLDKLGRINTGSTPSTSNNAFWTAAGTPFVTPGELGTSSPIVSAERNLTPEGRALARVAPRDAVLVCCIGSLGKVGIAGTEVVTNQQINWIDFSRELVHPRYGYYACLTLKAEMVKKAPSTTVPILNKSSFSKLEIPLPPLSEQKRIAAILDKADQLRQKRRQAIGLLDSLTQSIFVEMFGVTKSVQLSSPTTTLSDLVHEFRYGTSEKSQIEGYPALRIPNIVGGSVSLSDLKYVPATEIELARLQLQEGDVLFVRTNGNRDYVGRSAVVTSEIAEQSGQPLSQFIYASYLIRARIKSDKLNPHFLQAFLSGPVGRKMLLERAKTSAGQYNINTEGLGNLIIPLPPLEQQAIFERNISKINNRKNFNSSQLLKIESLFSSLQHRAFSGQL